MSTEAEIRIRVADVLAQRDVPMQPVLAALQAGGTSWSYLGVSALTDRMGLLVPSTPEAFSALRPDLAVPEVPPDALWRVRIAGSQFEVGVAITDLVGPREMVEEFVPAPAREPWLGAIQALLGFAHGSMMNFTRWYTAPRATMSIKYPDREGELEQQFVRGIDDVAARLGISAAQRTLWKTIYPLAGANVALSVSTECGPQGPEPRLAIQWGASTWDRTIDVTNAILGRTSVEARESAARLGMLAGALEIEQPRGLEIVLGTGERPEVMVWLAPR